MPAIESGTLVIVGPDGAEGAESLLGEMVHAETEPSETLPAEEVTFSSGGDEVQRDCLHHCGPRGGLGEEGDHEPPLSFLRCRLGVGQRLQLLAAPGGLVL